MIGAIRPIGTLDDKAPLRIHHRKIDFLHRHYNDFHPLMKLATLKDGSRDGQLIVVSRDLRTASIESCAVFILPSQDGQVSA